MSLFGTYLSEHNEDNNEIINEVTVYEEPKFAINVDPTSTEPGFAKDPYIKVSNSSDWRKADEVARIHLSNCAIDYNHTNRGGRKNNFKITSEIMVKLNAIMDYKVSVQYIDDNGHRAIKEITVYERIWEVIHAVFPDAPYIKKPDFRKCYVRNK